VTPRAGTAILGCTSLIALLAAGQAPPDRVGSDQAPSEVVETTPTAETTEVIDPQARRILDRGIEAMGGRSSREALTSSRSMAVLSMGDGDMSSSFQLLTRKPGLFLTRQSIEGLGEMEIGCDGTRGWRKDPPDGLLTEIDIESALEFAGRFDLQALVREIDLRFTEARVLGPETVEEVPCTVLAMMNGKQAVKVYYEDASGLPRVIEISEAGRGKSSRRVVIEQWSDPTEMHPMRWMKKLRIEQPRQTIEATYKYVTFDDVSESTFIAPHALDATGARK